MPTEFHTPAPVITLYRSPDDPWADEIQEALDEMVIAYETETIADGATPPEDVPQLPALRDEGEVVTGKDALRAHLDDLRALMGLEPISVRRLLRQGRRDDLLIVIRPSSTVCPLLILPDPA